MSIHYVNCDERLKIQIGMVMGTTAERHLHVTDGFTIIALDEEQPVGIIAVYPRSLPAPLSETIEWYIDIIEVVPLYRRHGIARRLVAMAIERVGKEGAYQLRAWSSEDKLEAIPMWKALGFGLCPATVYPQGQEVRGFYVTYPIPKRYFA